jgi:dTMP kinase
MLITFEGIDGCGKSTQISLLAEYLKSKNIDFITLREPGGTHLSEEIRKILLESKHTINPLTELLLFNSARSNLVSQVIEPALAAGKVILCDRFYDSTTAYQGYGRGIDLDFIKSCNEMVTKGIKPDITFYLDIPLEVSRQRIINNSFDRIENDDDDFFSRIISGFKTIAEQEPKRIVVIDATKDISIVYQLIVASFEKKFQKKL